MVKNNQLKTAQRFTGIDLVKILAMFMVTVVHITGKGGAADAADNTAVKAALCLLDGISYCCINLFALSTGFLLYGKKAKISRLLQLWIQVIFWSVFSNVGVTLIKKDLSILTNCMLTRVFVLSDGTYWYFSSYFGMFLFIPLLNYAMERINRKQFTAFLSASIFLFGIVSFIFAKDGFKLIQGYSVMWLICLYLIGAGIRKFNLFKNAKAKKLIAVSALCIILEWAADYFSRTREITILNTDYTKIYSSYNFLPVFIMSITLFALFTRIKSNNVKLNRITSAIVSVSFTVYLIQCSNIVWKTYVVDYFRFIGEYSLPAAIGAVLGIAAAAYVLFTVLGLLQKKLFEIVKVDRICDKAEEKLKTVFDNIYSKIADKAEV